MEMPWETSQKIEAFFEKFDKLTKTDKILICFGTFILIVGGFFCFSYLPKAKKIKVYKVGYETLVNNLGIAKKNARKLGKYVVLLEDRKAEFSIVKKALPEKKEIPSLISGISEAGLTSGLDFILFQPESERKKDFYAEIPISIKVTGGFHNLVLFFDKVSRLPRIVNVEDINISVAGGGFGEVVLNTSCQAVTYQFIDKKVVTRKQKKRT